MRSSSAKKLKELEEEHNDVNVEDHGSDDVVINAKLVSSSSNNKLGVDKDVESVENDAESCTEWEEHSSGVVEKSSKKGEHHLHAKNHKKTPAKEWSAKHCVVSLSEAGIDTDGHCNGSGEQSGKENIFFLVIVESANESKDVGPANGEDSKHHIVGGRFSCNVLAAGDGTENNKLKDDCWSIQVPCILDSYCSLY